MPNLPPQSFDIVYIDGNHDAIYVEKDLEMAYKLMKPSGLMIVDDYLYQPPPEAHFDPPKLGVDRFVMRHSENLDVTYAGYQVFVKRQVKSPPSLEEV